MDAFIASLSLVALGEIGDKTQLLSFALATRYRRHWPILAGITLATLVNHGVSAWFGGWIAEHVPDAWLQWGLGLGFILLGLWMLIPDDDNADGRMARFGPFVASLVLFFLAEIGDKTQIATIALGARFEAEFLAVLVGTTLGMIAANVPVIWLGTRLISPVVEKWAHRVSAALFVIFGVITLLLGP